VRTPAPRSPTTGRSRPRPEGETCGRGRPTWPCWPCWCWPLVAPAAVPAHLTRDQGLRGWRPPPRPPAAGRPRRSHRPSVGRRPVRVLAQVGLAVAADEPDDHLGHDPSPDRPQVLAAGGHLGLTQHVEPQRRAPLQVQRLQVLEVGRGQLGQLHGPGHPLARRHLHGQVAQQVAGGQRGRLPLGLAEQPEQDRGELGVDLLVGPHPAVAEVEEGLPVDEPPGGAPPAAQIGRVVRVGGGRVQEQGEELLQRVVGAGGEVGPVAGADLGVAEAVGGHRELDRDEGVVAPVVVPGAVGQHVVDQRLADGDGQELVQDQPLVVPAHHPLGLGEQLLAGVADQGHELAVAGQVGPGRAVDGDGPRPGDLLDQQAGLAAVDRLVVQLG
jgi:hypothetical protein